MTNNNAGTVSVIDIASNTVTATITVGTSPWSSAVSSDGSKVYVVNLTGTVSVINAVTNTVVTTITVGTGPQAIAITPDNTHVYVANYNSSNVSVINTLTNTVTNTITTSFHPLGIAITPDGSRAYVINSSSPVDVINTSTNTIITSIPFNSLSGGIAITPDGTQAYVTLTSGNVGRIDLATNAFIAGVCTVQTSPFGVAFTPDGLKAFVANRGNHSVSVINTSTFLVITTITTVGTNPYAYGQFIQPASIPMTSIYTAPQGRLTLTSNTPVMAANATSQASVYYTPYQGNIVPIYDGANMQSYTFGQLTMSLSTTNQLSGNIYDLFVFLNSSVVTIAAGPAWSSATSRGTGAGTTQLQQINGLWVNANSITLKNGATSYSSIAAGLATYVGSVYMTANGQTGMNFTPNFVAGGTNNILGLYNAYNRAPTVAICGDSTLPWTYGTATIRAANNSTSNRISWLDGLQQSFAEAEYQVDMYSSSTATQGSAGISFDATNSYYGAFGASTVVNNAILSAHAVSPPLLGFHFVQAVERNDSGVGTVSYQGNGLQGLVLKVDM